jgi:proteasome lid subunit RPN8/RPN11
MISAFLLPVPLREQLASEALRTYPAECCGLIEGISRGETIEALALHPARNLASESDRFEIDPHEQFRLMHALRETDRDVVGCYHSHPDGVAAPSPRDREGAGEEGFVWLIAGVAANGTLELGAYVFAGGAFRPLRLA